MSRAVRQMSSALPHELRFRMLIISGVALGTPTTNEKTCYFVTHANQNHIIDIQYHLGWIETIESMKMTEILVIGILVYLTL